jgi:formylglycine-generating enzyme required for sulfatase activity
MTFGDVAASRKTAQKDAMIWIEGGAFRMGSDRHYVEEAPAHRVIVDGFWIDPTPVTNAQFAAFVKGEIDKWGKVIKAAGLKAE